MVGESFRLGYRVQEGIVLIRVALKAPRRVCKDRGFQQKNYSEGQPFFLNPRGVLVHRVKSVFRLMANYHRHAWWIVEYWCENSGRMDKSGEGMLSDPGNKLVCARCEERAVRMGEKTSSRLVGRHVCVGAARAVNICRCGKSEEISDGEEFEYCMDGSHI